LITLHFKTINLIQGKGGDVRLAVHLLGAPDQVLFRLSADLQERNLAVSLFFDDFAER